MTRALDQVIIDKLSRVYTTYRRISESHEDNMSYHLGILFYLLTLGLAGNLYIFHFKQI